jgi:O-antigen/teichoic acid export membrane protein
MIGTISVGSAENGYYEQAQKIIRICWTFVTTFGTVMSPRLAYIFANKDRAEVRGQMRRSFRFVWFLSIPITFGLISITDNLVPWFFGDEFLSVKTLLYVFSWIVIPVGLNAITGNQYIVATKRQTWYTISVIVGAASNFVLNLILIPRFLSTGAAIASVIAELLIASVQIYYIVIRLKELDFSDVTNGAFKYSISGIIMLAVNLLISRFLPSTLLSTLLLVTLGAFIYLGTLLISKDEIALTGFHRLTTTIKKVIHW